MNKQRKTSNILNVFQYDETTGAVTLPSTLVLTAPAGSDNSTKVPTTAWTRTYISSLGYVTGNQSISITGDATGSGTTSIELTLANTTVTPGTYGSATLVPVVTVDSKGRITSVTTASISGALTFTGDVTGTGTTGSSTTLTLANSGVTAGTFTKLTVDSKGRVTVGANATTSDISEGTNLYYTDARVLAYLGANNYATQSYVGTQIANLVDSAPGTLDTLNELAAALGDDPNFATTTATSLGNRLRIDIGTQGLSSTQQGYGRTNLGLGSAALSAIGDFATAAQGTKADTAHGWGNHASAGYLTSVTDITGNAGTVTNGVYTTGSYANPSWITSLAYSKITGVPAFLTSYTETDTLATVTGRGASTSTAVTFNGNATFNGLLNFAAVGNVSFTSNDTNSYPRLTGNYSSAQLGLFRAGSAVGGMYIGGTGTGFYVFDSSFNIRLLINQNGDTAFNSSTVTVGGNQVWHAGNLTNLNQLTNGPGYITGYTETDTLATVTSRGATTTGAITVSGRLTANGAGTYAVTGSSTQRYIIQALNTSNSVNSSYGWWWFHNANGDMGFHADGIGDLFTISRGGTITAGSSTGPVIINTSTIESYSPTLTGSGASGTWGINVTGTSGSTQYLSALGSYVWSASSLPNTYHLGITSSFVSGSEGFQSYGSVMTMRTYSGGGGSLQLYVPYSPTYGGSALQVRYGNYDAGGNAWTSWKTLIDSSNIGSQSVNYASSAGAVAYANITASSVTGWMTSARNGTGAMFYLAHSGGYGMHINSYTTTAGVYILELHNNSAQVFGVYADGAVRINGNTAIHAGNYTSYRGTQLISPNGATVVAADSAMPDTGHSFIHSLALGPGGNDGHILGMTWASTTSVYGAQIWMDTDPTNRMAIRSRNSSGVWNGWSEVITDNNYTSYAVPTGRTLTINGTAYDLSANRSWTVSASAAWSSITSGYRENYDLRFRPSNDSSSYAGLTFSKPGSSTEDGGYLLIRGGADNDVYTQYGITLVADGGWLTLAQRTTASKGVRIMTGTTSAVRISVTDSTTTINNTLNLASLASNDGMIENNTGGYFHLGGWGVGRTAATAILVNTAYWADNAGNADTVDSIHGTSFVRNDTTSQYLKPFYEYGNYLTTQSPADLKNQMGGGGLRVDFMHPSYAGGGSWNHVITWSGYQAYNMYQLGGYYDGGTSTNLYVRSEANHGNTSWTSWRRLLNETADPYAANMNQYVRTSDGPTFADVYTTGWFRNHTNTNGIYWSTTGWHLMPYNSADFRMHSGNSDAAALRMETNGTIRGYMYVNSSNQIGFLNNSRSWSFRVHSDGRTDLGGDTTASIYVPRHLEARDTWGSCGCISLFLGWSSQKVIIGNGNSGGHDYANGLGSNSVVSTNPFYCYQDITAYSDSRVKENVEVIEDAVEKVKAIRGVTFTRNDVEDLNKRHAGVIAQEILQVLPEAVSEDSRGHLSVAYGNLTSLLIEAIKEQQTQIEDLKNKLDLLTQNK